MLLACTSLSQSSGYGGNDPTVALTAPGVVPMGRVFTLAMLRRLPGETRTTGLVLKLVRYQKLSVHRTLVSTGGRGWTWQMAKDVLSRGGKSVDTTWRQLLPECE